MSSNIVEKYKSKKKKDLASYSKILEKIITLENNNLWKTNQKFNSICRGIIDYFVDNYYFDNNRNRNNPIEYSNDNINNVLLSIVEYYKLQNQSNLIKEMKNETFVLAVIVCTAAYVDIAANVIDGDYISLKNKLKALLKHLSKTKLLKVYANDKVTINSLFEKVRKSIAEEEKFFSYFEELDCKNEYQKVSNNPLYYKVRFVYKLEDIEKYDKKLVEKYRSEYIDKYLNICYELLLLLLLKENLMNRDIGTYLIPVTDTIISKDNGLKVFDIPNFKEHIKLSISLLMYEENKKNINKMIEKGFKIIYRYSGTDIKIFNDKSDMEVLCTKEFLTNNSTLIGKLKEKNIVFVEENSEKNITEKVILNKKEN